MACTSRCRGGRLERTDLTAGCRQPDAVSDLKTFTALLRARHVYIPVVDDAPFETLLEYCCGGNRYIPFSRYLLSLPLSLSIFLFRSHHLVVSTHESNSKNGFSGFERSTAANAESRSMCASKLNVDSGFD